MRRDSWMRKGAMRCSQSVRGAVRGVGAERPGSQDEYGPRRLGRAHVQAVEAEVDRRLVAGS